MKKIAFTLLLLAFSLSGFGQDSASTKNTKAIAKNTIYFELFGNGGLYSISYDRILFHKNKFKISGMMGFSYLTPFIGYNFIFNYPIGVNFIYGKRDNIEIGLGCTTFCDFYSLSDNEIYPNPVVRIGYRDQKLQGGFFFKAGLSFFLRPSYYNYYGHVMPGFSFGYTFKNKKDKRDKNLHALKQQPKEARNVSHIAKNTLYFELAGNAGLYSINYDRILFHKKHFKISGMIGFSYSKPYMGYKASIPLSANFIYGKRDNIELGLGCTTFFDAPKNPFTPPNNEIYPNPVVRIGYRLQKPQGGFFFKIGVLLFYKPPIYDTYSHIWYGLGFGYTFKNKQQ